MSSATLFLTSIFTNFSSELNFSSNCLTAWFMFSELESFSFLSEVSIVLDWAVVSTFFCVLFFVLLQAERRVAEIRAMPAN